MAGEGGSFWGGEVEAGERSDGEAAAGERSDGEAAPGERSDGEGADRRLSYSSLDKSDNMLSRGVSGHNFSVSRAVASR